MNKKKIIISFINLIMFIVFICVDQWTKLLAITNLRDQQPISIWKDILELQYLENKGAAFGMLQNKKILFIFIAVVMITIILYVLVKLPTIKKYYIWNLFLILIASGGIGNMIDRLQYDYVVDFIYFKIINFPIFNMADVFVCIGTAILIINILFFMKEDDLDFLKFKMK